MNRLRWAGYSLAIVTILAVVAVAAATRHPPGSTSPRGAGMAVEDWASYLASVDRALAANDLGLASRRWRDAYGAALRSQRWEAMVAAGDAALRIGRAAGTMSGFDAEARQCYLTALFRARAQQSLDGVLLAAEAFGQLGDLEVARGALRMADGLVLSAPDAPRGPERVAALHDRLDAARSAVRDASLLPEE